MVKINEITSMFWGVTLEGDKRYSQTTETPIHLSMAALDTTRPQADGSTASVMIECKGSSYVLCTLQHGKLFQQPLDLEFAAGEHLVLYITGKGSVHLSGYLIPQNDDYDFGGDSDDDLSEPESEALSDDSDAESDDEATNVKSKRKLMIKGGKNAKKARMTIDDLDENDEDDSDDDDFVDSEAEEGSDDDLELEDDFDDEESDDDAEPSKPAGKKAKIGNGTSAKAAVVNVPAKSKAKATPPTTAAVSQPQNVAAGSGDTEGKKKKKKKNKKNKNKDAGENQQQASETKTDSTTTTPVASKLPTKRTAEGGVVVEDLKEGHGPEAKLGKMVRVYYSGRLANGKMFDSCLGGNGFKFKLGKKEVISGWDVGIAGMKVGGKRKLTIPPKMGYGFQAVGGIPPNSTLVFDVELKAVN